MTRQIIMILVSALFFLYFLLLVLFSLVRHSVYYCVLLVAKSLVCRFICYYLFGFSWYPLLFCLVYIGGVYILFVFVSIYRPNNSYMIHIRLNKIYLFLGGFILFIIGRILLYELLKVEFRRFLCPRREGIFYVFICFTLLFGFLILRMIMRVKLNHYR